MPWIGAKDGARSPAKRPASSQAPTTGSFELQTTLRFRGKEQGKAIVEELTARRCRIVCLMLLEPNAVVEFDVQLPKGSTTRVCGRVLARGLRPPRFVYDLSLDRTAPRVVDELARSLAHCYRAVRARRTTALPAESSGFAMQYRRPKGGFRSAKARDVSTAGLRMVCSEALMQGTLLEVHMTLPDDGPEMLGFARVTFVEPLGNDSHEYCLTFCGLERRQYEQLSRYAENQSSRGIA